MGKFAARGRLKVTAKTQRVLAACAGLAALLLVAIGCTTAVSGQPVAAPTTTTTTTSTTTSTTTTTRPSDDLTVGDCARIVDGDTEQGAQMERVDCADPGATLAVAHQAPEAGGCPEGDYITFTEGLTSTITCMTFNATVGHCFRDSSNEQEVSIEKVGCGPGADRVVHIANEFSADGSACSGTNATTYRSYSVPPLTQCFAPV